MIWQPIETAPKDGTEVDLWVVHGLPEYTGRYTNCKWSEFEVSDYPRKTEIGWNHYECAQSEWKEFAVEREGLPNRWGSKATHWMPLPEPPKEAEHG